MILRTTFQENVFFSPREGEAERRGDLAQGNEQEPREASWEKLAEAAPDADLEGDLLVLKKTLESQRKNSIEGSGRCGSDRKAFSRAPSARSRRKR